MRIWKSGLTLADLKARDKGTMVGHIGIELTELGDDFLKARMPVDERTKQPFGILHGGASAALAETIGSIASGLCIDDPNRRPVGIELNANHVRPVYGGWVYGVVTPINIGRNIHIWDIRISNEDGKLVCISRLTVSIISI